MPDKPIDIYRDHCMFRANRLEDGEEVYGSLVTDGSAMGGPLGFMPPTCVYHIIQLCTINGKPHNSDDLVDPDTVGIFMGRTNEYGRAIYEPLADFLRRALSDPPNEPLTLEELAAINEPTPLWIEHLESNCSVAAPGEWLIYKPCVPTRVHPYFCFGDKALCAYYYGKGWLAYRHKPEGGGEDG